MILSKMTRLGAVPALLGFLVACSSPSKTEGSGGAETGSSSASSAGTGGAACQPYQVPAGTDLTTPTVSLMTDIMPIFNANCGAAACHGTPDVPGLLFLGAETAMGSDAAMVRTGIVGVASTELTTMPYVTASDPTKSYLMHKLDWDACQYAAECTVAACGADMPNGGAQLPVATRDTVRRWIAQGAGDD
jgi:hypothetical protein